MDILIVSQYFWPEEFVVNSLALDLKARGHKVKVITGLPNYPKGVLNQGYSLLRGPWYEEYQGIPIYRIPLLPRKSGFVNLALNYLSFVLSGITFGLFRLTGPADIIFCFGTSPATACIPGIVLKIFKRAPFVYWVQDLWPESIQAVGAIKNEKIINAVGAIVKLIYKFSDLIMIQSEAFRGSVQEWGGNPGKCRYIPNWFPESVSLNEVPQWVLNLPQGFRVIFAGNIGKAQSMDTIVDAAYILRTKSEIKWIIVGDGSELERIQKRIAAYELSNNVFCLGRKSSTEMSALFSAGDAMLVTLTDEPIFNLTVPSKIQAYMAAGKPIIAGINGEGARIIDKAKAGIAVPAEDAEALAASTLRVFEMPESERNQLGINGRAFFEQNFQQKIVIDKIEAEFKKLSGVNK